MRFRRAHGACARAAPAPSTWVMDAIPHPAPVAGSDRPDALHEFLARHRRLFVLTGAGCSTASGIPDYRDAEGGWKRVQPVTFQAFTGDAAIRRRYWARSLAGTRTRAKVVARSARV